MLDQSSVFDLRLVVTGTHLSHKFGHTINEIIADGLSIAYRLPFPLEHDEAGYLSTSVAKLGESFATVIAQDKPDLIMVLGDRYEILPLVNAAVIQRILVAHIHGGETTLGAIDNKFRHAVTQMADIHFVATDAALAKVNALCPDNNEAHHVGSLSIDKLHDMLLLDRATLCDKFEWYITDKAVIITFHPETMSALSPVDQVDQLIAALDDYADVFMVITLSNADAGGQSVSKRLIEFGKRRNNVIVRNSLGYLFYLSCVASFDLVIGNSSSGIIEAPFFGTPTINIGDRQAGREMADTIISVPCEKTAIRIGISQALQDVRKRAVDRAKLPYGKSNATQEIVSILERLSADIVS